MQPPFRVLGAESSQDVHLAARANSRREETRQQGDENKGNWSSRASAGDDAPKEEWKVKYPPPSFGHSKSIIVVKPGIMGRCTLIFSE